MSRSARLELHGERVWVTGHTGMVGGAVCERLAAEDCEVLRTARGEVDLACQAEVESWATTQRPDMVVVAAAKVGGIHANSTYPAEFIHDNIAIATNVIHSAWKAGVRKLLFLGSSCIYPRDAAQPIREDALLTGPLEPTNEWYAVAKIAGVKLCQAYRAQYGCDFVSAMPTNLYGPGDNFHPTDSHVPAALMRRFHEAKLNRDEAVSVWGSGSPRREFLYVGDLADACVHLLCCRAGPEIVNVGTGTDLTIREFAVLMKEIVGFRGALRFDPSRPDGTPRKLLDVGRLTGLGWTAPTALADGLARTYAWFEQAYREGGIAERGH